jgi:ribosomal protein L37AE/L43A
MITCENCGKTRQGQEVGNHWICGDCRVEETTEATEEQATNDNNKGTIH